MKSVTDFQNILRTLQDNSGIAQLMDDIKRRDEQMRAIVKSAEDLRRIGDGFDAVSRWRRDIEQAGQVFENYKRFRLPEISETARLMEQLRTSGVSETLERYALQASSLQRAMENMRMPWLDVQDAVRSMTAFSELQ